MSLFDSHVLGAETDVASASLDHSVWNDMDHPGFLARTQFVIPDDEDSDSSEDGIEDSQEIEQPLSPVRGTQQTSLDAAQPPMEIKDMEASRILHHSSFKRRIHPRYVKLLHRVSAMTSTEEEGKQALKGIPEIVLKLVSIRLDIDYTARSRLDLWACALVIHTWQLFCYKWQTDNLTPDPDYQLSSRCTSYFLTAWEVLSEHAHPSAPDDVPKFDPSCMEEFEAALHRPRRETGVLVSGQNFVCRMT